MHSLQHVTFIEPRMCLGSCVRMSGDRMMDPRKQVRAKPRQAVPLHARDYDTIRTIFMNKGY